MKTMNNQKKTFFLFQPVIRSGFLSKPDPNLIGEGQKECCTKDFLLVRPYGYGIFLLKKFLDMPKKNHS